jgi:uncharacterized protein YndB with AHSA1/START domain
MRASNKAGEAIGEREHVIAREFDAPARLLFEAWSKPEHLMKWFGPKGWPLTLCEMDFRKGGKFRFAMTGPNGKQNVPFGGEYLEIVADRKIVYDNAFEMPNAPKMLVTVTFDAMGDQTTLTIHTLFESVAMRNEYVGAGMREGYSSALDLLEGVVAAIKAGAPA